MGTDWNAGPGQTCKRKSVKLSEGNKFDGGNITIENTPKTFNINITKKDSVSGAGLEGVGFGLFTTEPIKLGNGEVIPTNSMVAYGKTNASGQLTLGNGLPANQNYILKEILFSGNIDAIVDGSEGKRIENGVEINLSTFISDEHETKEINITINN